MQLLRIKGVMKKTGLARSTVWLWVKEGKLPKPTKLSERVSVWEESSIDEWLQNKMLEG